MPQKMRGNYGCFFTSADGLREQRVGGGERRSEAGRASSVNVLLFDGPFDRIDSRHARLEDTVYRLAFASAVAYTMAARSSG